MLRSPPGRPEDRRRRRRSPIAEAFGGSHLAGGIDAVNLKYALRKIKTDGGNLHGGGSSLWRHTTTTTLGTRCRSAGAVHPINSNGAQMRAASGALEPIDHCQANGR